MLEKRTFDFVLLDDIYYKVDNSGKILYVSSSVKKILGYDKEELIGLHLHQLYVNPQNRAKNYEKIDRSIANFKMEDLLKHKNGSHVFMSTNAHFVKDKSGNIVGIEGLSRDTTREYELKKRLSHNEKTYKAIFENSPSGIIYHDSKGKVIEANKAALKIFGVTKEQFMGFDLLKEIENEDLKKAIEKSLRGEKSHFKGVYVSIIAKKRMYLEVSFQAIKDEEGNVIFTVASIDDQTAMEKALKNVQRSKEDWKSIIDNMQNIFMQTDKEGNIIKVSPSIKTIAGYEQDEILGKNISSLWANTKETQYFREKYIQNPQPVQNMEFLIFHKNGNIMYFDCNLSPRFDKQGKYAGSDNFIQDITELKKTQKQIEHMALHDTLTALPNRAMLMSMLEHSISGAKRAHDQMAVLFLDLDNFKDINDNFGHQEGDKVLIKMAESLKKALRLDDMIFRFGGDEFVVIAEHIKHNEDVINIIQKIKKIFTAPFHTELHSYYLSCSIGIALYPEDALSPERLIRSADTAMYKAKNSGRDRYAFYSKELGRKIQKELYIENLLREAFKKDEFELYYQPQISLIDNKIVGIEALIRWNNKELGFVHPESFISIAEKTKLISAIDIWVLRTACSQVKKWHDAGIYNGKLSVNISGVDLNNENMAILLHNILSECCLEAKYLDLEITETVLMSDPKHSIKLFDRIKEMGIDISIDDFGTGYSSLSYLRMFPIDELKIDKSFVDDLPQSKDASAIVNTIISLAKTLGYKTVAEGVETIEQLEHLKMLGCDIVQGYYYSKALNIDDIEVYFQKFL